MKAPPFSPGGNPAGSEREARSPLALRSRGGQVGIDERLECGQRQDHAVRRPQVDPRAGAAGRYIRERIVIGESEVVDLDPHVGGRDALERVGTPGLVPAAGPVDAVVVQEQVARGGIDRQARRIAQSRGDLREIREDRSAAVVAERDLVDRVSLQGARHEAAGGDRPGRGVGDRVAVGVEEDIPLRVALDAVELGADVEEHIVVPRLPRSRADGQPVGRVLPRRGEGEVDAADQGQGVGRGRADAEDIQPLLARLVAGDEDELAGLTYRGERTREAVEQHAGGAIRNAVAVSVDEPQEFARRVVVALRPAVGVADRDQHRAVGQGLHAVGVIQPAGERGHPEVGRVNNRVAPDGERRPAEQAPILQGFKGRSPPTTYPAGGSVGDGPADSMRTWHDDLTQSEGV